VDGSGFKRVRDPVALPGSRVVTTFNVTNLGTNLVDLELPGTPVNPVPGILPAISEVFLVDGKRLLQLTNFHRVDTFGLFLSVDRRRAFFAASADPLGRNPSENCQVFSIDTFGAHLRQVTDFNRGRSAGSSCADLLGPGCRLDDARQDPATRSVVFYASCDPLGTNPYGGQVFAMRPDGSGLRQLTAARGFATDADGTVRVELPGPIAYSAIRR